MVKTTTIRGPQWWLDMMDEFAEAYGISRTAAILVSSRMGIEAQKSLTIKGQKKLAAILTEKFGDGKEAV